MRTLFIFLLVLTSCGKSGGGPAKKSETLEVVRDTKAQYRVVFGALNGKSSFGTASFEFEEEKKLRINFNMIDLPGQVSHGHNLHLGEKCPSIENDLNKDGFVDYAEGLNVFGEASYAFQSEHGSYYNHSDLLETHELPSDLVLQGKALVVYGTSERLPATVVSKEGETPESSLPVACGIIQKVFSN